MKRLELSLSALLVVCGAAHAAPPVTPAMGFEIEGVWLSAAPELFTEFKPEEIWAARTMALTELAAGVKLSGDHVKQGRLAGRWANHPQFPTIHTQDIPHDWRGVKSLSFWARSEVATGELITLALLSDGPQTAWKDYYYHVYYHKLTLAPQRQRLFLCYWTQSAALCLFRDEYYAAVYMWPDRQKPFLEGNPELPLGSFEHQPAKYQFYSAPPSELTVIVSAGRGKTWRLATTEDFRQ